MSEAGGKARARPGWRRPALVTGIVVVVVAAVLVALIRAVGGTSEAARALNRAAGGSLPAGSLRVVGTGMEPTVKPGARLVYYAAAGELKRGDVVVYQYRDKGIALSRVVALPGDSVEVHAGRLVVNGAVVAEPYVAEPAAYEVPRLQLDSHSYYLLNDNRNHASDSHVNGPVQRQRIIGVVNL